MTTKCNKSSWIEPWTRERIFYLATKDIKGTISKIWIRFVDYSIIITFNFLNRKLYCRLVVALGWGWGVRSRENEE